MDIQITQSAPPATAMELPEFPLVRFDTGMVVYEEALLNGQYLVVNTPAMGRPKFREWIWNEYGGQTDVRPSPTRPHAFQIEIDGQLLADRWEWVDAHEEKPARPDCREAVVVLWHGQRPVRVEIHTQIDDTAVLTRWLVITNMGERHAAVALVFPWPVQIWATVGNSWETTELPASPFTIGMFGHYCVSGIFPAMGQQHTAARNHWQHAIAPYKSFVRPMLSHARLFHHTPIQHLREAGSWIVLKCIGKDTGRGFADVFWHPDTTGGAHHFVPRGLAADRRYHVHPR